jgi:PAS domain S-box-containing protein
MSLADPAFRMIFENVPIGIAVVGRDLKVVEANAAYCEMLGYTKEEIVGLHVPDFTHPDDRQRDIEFVPLLFSRQIPHYKAEKRYVKKDGGIVWGNVVATALVDAKGEAQYVFGLVEDITERKTLRGLLPVCASCKKVRDDKGYWSQVEVYLHDHVADVNVGLCPECVKKRSRA